MSTKLKKPRQVNSESDTYGLTWDIVRVTEERKNTLLKNFREWIELEDSLQVMSFLQSQKITPRLWSQLVKKYPEFEEINSYGVQLIGYRREKLMWLNKINAGVALRTQRLYADDFQKIYQDGIDFQNKLASKETNIRFLPVLPPVEETGVRPKEVTDETL